MAAIGMMDSVYFVGRKEIIEWINETLELNITKIEDTAFGGIACQLLDIMYPGQVAIHKVDWSAKQSFEYVANYKILQNAFVKLGISKNIEIERLVKARYQDNFEFMQWFKRFFEVSSGQNLIGYDCFDQRSKGKGGAQYNKAMGDKSTGLKTKTLNIRENVEVLDAPVTVFQMSTSNRRKSIGGALNSTVTTYNTARNTTTTAPTTMNTRASRKSVSSLDTQQGPAHKRSRQSLAPTYSSRPSPLVADDLTTESPTGVTEVSSVRRSNRLSLKLTRPAVSAEKPTSKAGKSESKLTNRRTSLGAIQSVVEAVHTNIQEEANVRKQPLRRASLGNSEVGVIKSSPKATEVEPEPVPMEVNEPVSNTTTSIPTNNTKRRMSICPGQEINDKENDQNLVNAKKRRASLLEIQNKINAIVEQVGMDDSSSGFMNNSPATAGGGGGEKKGNSRRRSLRISLLAENTNNNVVWLDI